MDDKLKDVLNGEGTVVPEFVSERVKLILNSLPEHRKSRKIKHILVAAGIVVALTLGITAVNPTLAQNIPIVNSVFNYFYVKNAMSEGYIKYAQGVNQTVTDEGISITVDEVVCDSSTLSIGYTVISENKLSNINDFSMDFKIDGNELNVGYGGSGRTLDDYTYVGITEMDIARKKIPDKFKFDLKVRARNVNTGKWNFKFAVSKEDIEKDSKIFKTDIKVQFEDSDIIINQVSFTPINTTIIYNGVLSENKAASKGHREMKYENWFLFDDKGRQIQAKGSSSSGSDNEFSCEKHFYGIKEIPKYVTVIPYENVKDDKAQYNTKDLTGEYPIMISQGKIGSIIIKKVEFLKEKTLVYYSTEGIAPLNQSQALQFMDENGNEILSRQGHIPLSVGDSPNSFIKEFPSLDSGKKYKISTINYDDFINVREDLKFTIPIEK